MKFRQRVAWLLVLLYLAATFGLIYYLFEINEHYNVLALEHVQKFHPPVETGSKERQESGESGSVWSHLTDLPLPLWIILLVLPYLQVFLMLLACTRAEPRLSLAYLWPGLVYLKCQKLFGRQRSARIPLEHCSTLTNGYTVIHA